ncbi:MAG: glycosyltransferase family 4 protein [candidate division WOR-3 bacterium]
MRKVVVSHPGRQHSHQLAYALQEGKILLKYFTGLWYKPDKFPYSILKKIPQLEKEFKKRYFEKINPEYVVQNPFPEIKYRFILKDKNPWLKIGMEFDKWVSKKLKKLDFDIFIGYELSSYQSFKVCKEKNKICIYDLPIVAYNFQKEIFKKYGKKYDEREIEIKKKELSLADYIIVPSEIVKESLIKLNIPERKIVKIHYGVDISKFLPKEKYDKDKILKILFVGQVTWRKGIENLMKVLKELKGKINFEFNIAGGAPEREILEKYKGLYNYYSFLPHEKLVELYKRNDIFVFPSLFEGFAQVVLESMACGLPVIVSNKAGSSDIVRDGIDGFIISPDDINSLKEKILYFYYNKEEIERMGKNASEQARKYTWEKYRENILKFIKEL